MYRHRGIRRVALLDFDVHHGNGTEACVSNTVPSRTTRVYETPFGAHCFIAAALQAPRLALTLAVQVLPASACCCLLVRSRASRSSSRHTAPLIMPSGQMPYS
jgi:Histone deacetylase domain